MGTKELTLFEGNFGEAPVTMSSREIASLTEKEHRNILRDCDELNESYEKLDLLKIEQITYKDSRNREQREYRLTRMHTAPEGFTPCPTAASPSGRHFLYSNGVPRYLFDGPEGRGRINPAHRWALIRKK